MESKMRGDAFRITFLNKARVIDITGRIDSVQSADELIRAVSAMKELLPRKATPDPVGAAGIEPATLPV